MTTIDKILNMDSINAVLAEVKKSEDNIEGLFVIYTTDQYEGYHARTRNFPTHILIGILTILLENLKLEGTDELTGEEENNASQ